MNVISPNNLPEGWRPIRLKWVLGALESGRREVSATDGFEDGVLSIGGEHIGWQGEWLLEKPRFVSREFFDEMSAGRIRENDILLVKDGATIGKVAIAKPLPAKHCAVNEHVFLLRVSAGNHAKYYFYVVQSSLIQDQIQLEVRGSAQPGLNSEFRNLVVVPEPPEPAQRSIAAFLDRETARIDKLIEKKRRQIELLYEKRSALISHAVTKGIDPNAPMKDSGLHWLGPIPAHWTIRRFRFDLRSVEQGWSPQCDNSPAELDEWGVLKVGCVNGIEFDESEHKRLPDDLEPLPQYEIKPGDILMSRANTTELLGSAVLVRVVRPRLMLCDKLYRMQMHPTSLDPEFLVFAFASHASRYQFERDATGASASMKNIGQDTIRALLLPRPPISEQRDIVRVLNARGERMRQVIGMIEASINRLREYRSAVISAAVTGKVNVRKEVA